MTKTEPEAPPLQDEIAEPETQEKRPPWYSLDPRLLSRSRLMKIILIALLLASFSAVPLWRLLWYFPVYNFHSFFKLKDSTGRKRQAWRWIEGREIRVYQLPGTFPGDADIIASGARELVRDANLDFEVKVSPIPDDVLAAYRASLVTKEVNAEPTQCVSFTDLESRLIALRDGDPHADILIVNTSLAETWWAHGMASFRGGLVVINENHVSKHLGKHETGHLMGYIMHDSFPLFVLGYPWEGSPWSRDTLMMLYGKSDDLSPRAADALHYFWRGLENRTGNTYLKN